MAKVFANLFPSYRPWLGCCWIFPKLIWILGDSRDCGEKSQISVYWLIQSNGEPLINAISCQQICKLVEIWTLRDRTLGTSHRKCKMYGFVCVCVLIVEWGKKAHDCFHAKARNTSRTIFKLWITELNENRKWAFSFVLKSWFVGCSKLNKLFSGSYTHPLHPSVLSSVFGVDGSVSSFVSWFSCFAIASFASQK